MCVGGYQYGLRPELWGPEDPIVTSTLEAASGYVEGCVRRLRAGGVSATGHTRIGAPAAIIAAFSQSLSADAIVMASHGRTALSRLTLGSVATGVLRHATMPLFVVGPNARSVARPEAA
jgi:nucleotide-binding universal stress UspA family protein